MGTRQKLKLARRDLADGLGEIFNRKNLKEAAVHMGKMAVAMPLGLAVGAVQYLPFCYFMTSYASRWADFDREVPEYSEFREIYRNSKAIGGVMSNLALHGYVTLTIDSDNFERDFSVRVGAFLLTNAVDAGRHYWKRLGKRVRGTEDEENQ